MSFTAGMYLTNAGRIVLAAAQAGNATINFSKFAFGDGNLGGGLEVERTALISQRDTQPITKIRANGDGTVTVGTKRPGSAVGGYYLREIGLFVTDPSNSANDILYAYANSGANAQYLPAPSNTAEIVEKTINVIVAIANGTTVTATIASGVSLTQSDMDAHNSATDAHAPRFNLLGTLFAPLSHASRHATTGDDPITPTLIGAESSGAASSAVSSHDSASTAHSELFAGKQNTMTPGTDYAIPAVDITATISTTWTGSAAPYTQNVAIAGMTTVKKIQVGLAPNATAAQYAAAAKAQLHCTAQAAGVITITAFGEKPTVAIPIIVRVEG